MGNLDFIQAKFATLVYNGGMKQRLKQSIICIILFMLPFQTVYAKIAKADSIAFLNKQIATLDDRDLVVFDMDEVLIVAIDAILHFKVEHLRKKLHANYLAHLPEDQLNHLFSHIWKNAKTTLVEPEIPSLIAALQAKGIKVIVLTAAPVGSFGTIEDTMALRILELAEKGIDLSLAFPELATLVLHEFKKGKSSPTFRQGVILSHRFPKGKVLSSFLKRVKWKPRRLIFIDDLLTNVESVEMSLSKRGIDLQCWHYTAAERHQKEVDMAVAELQIRTLVEKGVWLSDEEAAAALMSNFLK